MSCDRLSKGFVLSILFLLGCTLPSLAQSPGPSVQIKVETITWSGYWGDRYGPRFRFAYLPYNSAGSALSRIDLRPFNSACLGYNSAESGSVSPNVVMSLPAIGWNNSDLLFLYFTSHEERKSGSDECTAQGIDPVSTNKPDRFEQETAWNTRMSWYAPGTWSQQFSVSNYNDGSVVTFYFRFMYLPPQPTASSTIPNQGCANLSYNLNAGSATGNFTNLGGVSYQWQARIVDEEEPSYDITNCYDDCGQKTLRTAESMLRKIAKPGNVQPNIEPGGCHTICETTTIPANYHWFTIGTTSSNTLPVVPHSDIFRFASNSDNRDPDRSMQIAFQVRAFRDGNYGPWSNEQRRDIAPRAPVFSTPTFDASCTQSATGKINITGVSSVLSSFRYVVKETFNADIGCNVGVGGNCFAPGTKSGTITGGNTSTVVNVAGLKANQDYTVYVLNSGGTDGVCYSSQFITVGAVTTLDTDDPADVALTCFGGSSDVPVTFRNGKPSVNGSNVSAALYSTSNLTTAISVTEKPSPTVTVPAVTAGSYKIIINDGCTAPQEEFVTVTQPVKVNIVGADFTTGAATCMLPTNGEMKVKAEKTAGASNSNYFFHLTKDLEPTFVRDTAAGDTWNPKNLAPGSYRVLVSEAGANACNASYKDFTISAPPPLNVTATNKVDVLCNGGTTGSLTLSGSGGSLNFDYQVFIDPDHPINDAPNGSGAFDGIPAGDYKLRVFNTKGGCVQSYDNPTVVSVSQPSKINITLAPINISCFGEIDGVINSTISGGVPKAGPGAPYDYKWEWMLSSFTQISTDQNIDELEAGEYRLTVKDANQCEVSKNDFIIEPAALTISTVKVNDIACLGETGTIVVTPAGGTPGFTYQYALDGGSYQAFTPTTPLGVGLYKVRAIDSRLCSVDDEGTYEITLPAAVLDVALEWKDYNEFDVSCFGGSNGEVTLTASGGNGGTYTGYTFQKDGDAFVDDIKLTGFNAGDHAVRVKDARGCIVTKNVTLSQPTALATVEAVKTHVDCFGAATGKLTLNVSGGVLPFKYQLESGPQQDDPLFEDLAAATYTFTITDENQCPVTYQDEIINLNAKIDIQPTIVDAQCYDASDGTISLAVSGGVTPYKYSMAGEPITNFLDELHQGTYQVLVVDDKGCEMPSGDLVVNQPDLLEISEVDLHDIVCKDQKGTIAMTSIGGTLPYTYEYSKAGGAYIVFDETTPLVDDTYNVRVTDAHNCRTFYADNVVITNPPSAVDFTFEKKEYNGFNISCFGGSNGVITVTASGGNGAAYTKYFFAIDGGTFQEQQQLDHLRAGDHTIFVRDERGCEVTKDTYLTESTEALTAGISDQINARCFNEANGEVEVETLGGTSPYTFAIGTQLNFQQAPRFTGLAIGDYVITVADINDCRTTVPATIVSINPQMLLSKVVTDVNCFAGSDGKIDLTVSSGVAPFSYSWDKGQKPQASISGLKKDTYTVTITDAASCKISEAIAVSQPLAALAIPSISTIAACWDQSNGSLTAVATAGTSPYMYSIDDGRSYQSSDTFTGPVGAYTVTVKDFNGCTTTSPTEIKQRNNQPLVNFLAATENYALDTLVITEISSPKPDSINWVFDPAALVISDDQWNPQLKFFDAGNYPTTMTSYFGDCAYTLTKNIILSPYDPDRAAENLPGFKPIVSMQATPNPSTGKFTVVVELNTQRHLAINIYDVTGFLVEKKYWSKTKTVEWEVDISSKPAGMYVVRAVTDPDAEEVKVILNK